MKKRVITFGTFDVFHIGHLRIIERAAKKGDELIVGVSTDELNFFKKKCYPVFHQDHRISIIRALRHVNHAFFEESLEKKRNYIMEYRADILIMGDDWTGKFDYLNDLCEIIYISRTPSISTTEIIEKIRG